MKPLRFYQVFEDRKSVQRFDNDQHLLHFWAGLEIRVFRLVDSTWFDQITFIARRSDTGDISEAARDVLLSREPCPGIDSRVLFPEDGTWREMAGIHSDTEAIRHAIAELDSMWEICEPTLKAFLEGLK